MNRLVAALGCVAVLAACGTYTFPSDPTELTGQSPEPPPWETSTSAGPSPQAVAKAVVGRWVPADGPSGAYLEIEPGGELVATDACNSMGGRWVVDDDAVRLEDVVSGLKACSPGTANPWMVRADRLVRTTAGLQAQDRDGEVLGTYVRAD